MRVPFSKGWGGWREQAGMEGGRLANSSNFLLETESTFEHIFFFFFFFFEGLYQRQWKESYRLHLSMLYMLLVIPSGMTVLE